MAKRIKKDDPMYKEALSWMAYRYAIGFRRTFLVEDYIVEDNI